MYVKFEKVIVYSVYLMDLNTNLHLTLKLKMLKVKVKDKGLNGYCSSRCICMGSLKELRLYMHVKFERVVISSFPTMDLTSNWTIS